MSTKTSSSSHKKVDPKAWPHCILRCFFLHLLPSDSRNSSFCLSSTLWMRRKALVVDSFPKFLTTTSLRCLRDALRILTAYHSLIVNDQCKRYSTRCHMQEVSFLDFKLPFPSLSMPALTRKETYCSNNAGISLFSRVCKMSSFSVQKPQCGETPIMLSDKMKCVRTIDWMFDLAF